MMTFWLIIFYELIFIFCCVLCDTTQSNELNSNHRSSSILINPKDKSIINRSFLERSHLDHSDQLSKNKFSSFKLFDESSKISSNRKLRIKRENQLLINNNELTNGHDTSNTFQPSNGES